MFWYYGFIGIGRDLFGVAETAQEAKSTNFLRKRREIRDSSYRLNVMERSAGAKSTTTISQQESDLCSDCSIAETVLELDYLTPRRRECVVLSPFC